MLLTIIGLDRRLVKRGSCINPSSTCLVLEVGGKAAKKNKSFDARIHSITREPVILFPECERAHGYSSREIEAEARKCRRKATIGENQC